ncbi:MAG: sensor histidine kinase [Gemmatimonadaceae bacterium]
MASVTPTSARDGPMSFRRSTVPGTGTGAPLRALLIEDNPGDAELLADALSETAADGRAFSLRHVATLDDARVMLAGWATDVILLDLSLPDSHGLDSLEAVRIAAPDVPVVVMTGLADDGVALRAVQAGAQDYLVKGRDGAGAIRRAARHAVERQRLMRAAQEATRGRDEVLAIVSHDLRNPLGTIGMCAHVLVDPEMSSPERSRSMGEIILRSCDWMQRLIGDLLDVASIETRTLALDVEALPAGTVIDALDALYRPLAAEQHLTLVAIVAPDLPPVLGDAGRLVQALGNLVGNALKFTPAGGRVTIAAQPVDTRADGNGSAGGGAGVQFRVDDAGCGIAPEHLARVFDRYWQVRKMRRGGAGLGLTIAKGIIEAHGGTIAVESATDVGTTFTCTLPAAPSG